MRKDAPLGKGIQIACLPNPILGEYPTDYDQAVWAVGFGDINSNGKLPNKLQNVKFNLDNGIDNEICSTINPQNDWSSKLCAGIGLFYSILFIILKIL